MRLSELAQAGRQPPLPTSLELAEESLLMERWLRILPGQRYVGCAQWKEQRVLAKLLVGPKAAKQFQREYQGAQWLMEQQLVTPKLLTQALTPEGGWLLFEYLDSAVSLESAWQAVAHQWPLTTEQRAILSQALHVIARLHRVGLWQADLHLDNLLQHRQQLYLIDGGGVQAEHLGQTLSVAKTTENLGIFFAQLSPELEPHLETLVALYRQTNPVDLSIPALGQAIAKTRRWRLANYLKKAGRDCTLFQVQRGAMGLQAVWREALPALEPLVHNPDAYINQGHLYKTGGAATVVRIQYQGQPLVIKRYNIKNTLHWLKRFWRPSRAWHSWLAAHRLILLGIATPKPLAVMERRWCGLRGPAWLITEYLSGPDAISCFAPYLDTPPPTHWVLALQRLFTALIRERISHGDLKGHNLLWDESLGQWSLIDLDAMQQHSSAHTFTKAYRQDRARFLRNWPQDTKLYQHLNQSLPNL